MRQRCYEPRIRNGKLPSSQVNGPARHMKRKKDFKKVKIKGTDYYFFQKEHLYLKKISQKYPIPIVFLFQKYSNSDISIAVMILFVITYNNCGYYNVY